METEDSCFMLCHKCVIHMRRVYLETKVLAPCFVFLKFILTIIFQQNTEGFQKSFWSRDFCVWYKSIDLSAWKPMWMLRDFYKGQNNLWNNKQEVSFWHYTFFLSVYFIVDGEHCYKLGIRGPRAGRPPLYFSPPPPLLFLFIIIFKFKIIGY